MKSPSHSLDETSEQALTRRLLDPSGPAFPPQTKSGVGISYI